MKSKNGRLRKSKPNLKNFKKNSFSGFTLLELVVVFSIIAILSTIGLASYVNYGNNQVILNSASDLQNILNSAKQKAAAQAKPSSCLTTDVLSGYGVEVYPAPNTEGFYFYSLYALCNGNKKSINTYELPRGVQIAPSPLTTTNNVFFSVLTGSVTGSGKIDITGPSLPSSCVLISPSGIVSGRTVSCSGLYP